MDRFNPLSPFNPFSPAGHTPGVPASPSGLQPGGDTTATPGVDFSWPLTPLTPFGVPSPCGTGSWNVSPGLGSFNPLGIPTITPSDSMPSLPSPLTPQPPVLAGNKRKRVEPHNKPGSHKNSVLRCMASQPEGRSFRPGELLATLDNPGAGSNFSRVLKDLVAQGHLHCDGQPGAGRYTLTDAGRVYAMRLPAHRPGGLSGTAGASKQTPVWQSDKWLTSRSMQHTRLRESLLALAAMREGSQISPADLRARVPVTPRQMASALGYGQALGLLAAEGNGPARTYALTEDGQACARLCAGVPGSGPDAPLPPAVLAAEDEPQPPLTSLAQRLHAEPFGLSMSSREPTPDPFDMMPPQHTDTQPAPIQTAPQTFVAPITRAGSVMNRVVRYMANQLEGRKFGTGELHEALGRPGTRSNLSRCLKDLVDRDHLGSEGSARAITYTLTAAGRAHAQCLPADLPEWPYRPIGPSQQTPDWHSDSWLTSKKMKNIHLRMSLRHLAALPDGSQVRPVQLSGLLDLERNQICRALRYGRSLGLLTGDGVTKGRSYALTPDGRACAGLCAAPTQTSQTLGLGETQPDLQRPTRLEPDSKSGPSMQRIPFDSLLRMPRGTTLTIDGKHEVVFLSADNSTGRPIFTVAQTGELNAELEALGTSAGLDRPSKHALSWHYPLDWYAQASAQGAQPREQCPGHSLSFASIQSLKVGAALRINGAHEVLLIGTLSTTAGQKLRVVHAGQAPNEALQLLSVDQTEVPGLGWAYELPFRGLHLAPGE